MMPFIYRWYQKPYGVKQVSLTILLVFLGFLLGNLPVSWVFIKNGLFDVFEASRYLGFERMFLLQMIPFFTVLLALFFAVRKIHRVSWKDWITQRNHVSFQRVVFACLFWGAFLGLSTGLQVVFFSDSLHWNFEPKAFGVAVLMLLLLLPFQVLAEELLFRSYALQGFALRLKKPWIAVVLSGLLFGIMHLGNPEVSEHGYAILSIYVLLGVFLALITCLDGGIELAFGFHFANNFFSGILLTSKDQALQLPALYTSDSASFDALSVVLLMLGLGVFFFVAHRRYTWCWSALHQNIP